MVFVGDDITQGNSYASYERYITLYKPFSIKDYNLIAELEYQRLIDHTLYSEIKKKNKITLNGVTVLKHLKKLGWNNISYSKKLKHSDFLLNADIQETFNNQNLLKYFKKG